MSTTTPWIEARTFRPPERYTVSEWADAHRELDPINCSQPGPWETDFAPYIRGIMDAFSDPACHRLVLMGSTQWGKTESEINMMLWGIDQDPVPTLFVMPTEDAALGFARRVETAVNYCKPVRARKTARKTDWQRTAFAFDEGAIYFAWSNSPTTLASRSVGRVFIDETDKMGRFSGKEADPISLAEERLRWWPAVATLVLSSTPTTTDGYIWREWQGSDQRWFHLPCPFCGHYQPLEFGFDTVKIPSGERDPDRIIKKRLATYVCRSCGEHITDDGDHKRRMMMAGVWCPEGGRVNDAGEVEGVSLGGSCRGFHINALYSPMLSWSDVMAQFLRSKDDPAKLLNFTNSWKGWPWIEKVEATPQDTWRERVSDLPRGEIPAWSQVLTASVDVQDHELYWQVVAWGARERCHVVDYGSIPTPERNTGEDFDRVTQIVTTRYRCRAVFADIGGHRSDEVYEYARSQPGLVYACKGSSVKPRQPVAMSKGKPLAIVDTEHFKDKITRHVKAQVGSHGEISTHADPGEYWFAAMTSEHKGRVHNTRTKKTTTAWTHRPNATRENHQWDCLVYNFALAEFFGLHTLTELPETEPATPPKSEMEEQAQEGRRAIRNVRRKGWIRKPR